MDNEVREITVGIDLGTTHSLVAYMTPDGPRLIPNVLGEFLTPSVVGIDEQDRVVVGRAAKELQIQNPARCASVFKRDMGLDTQRSMAGRNFGAVELSSLVLKSLWLDVKNHLGREPQAAVITVPAYFDEQQRRATILAGRMAGWNVRRIINEPTAAAIAYGLHESDSRRTVAVFDLGGGTFDISLVDYFEGAIEVRASAGESVLGGEDFTRSLAREVLRRQGQAMEQVEFRQPKQLARLIQQCEAAKRCLSEREAATVKIPNPQGEITDASPEVTLDRAMLLECCEPILRNVAAPVRRVLADANVTAKQIDEVILVGGATRMPCVNELAQSLFGRPPASRLNPDEVVALGAAVQAALLDENAAVEDLVVIDVAPFSLGVEAAHELGHNNFQGGYFSPIIHRNTVIPASRVESFSTVTQWQDKIVLRIFQGESRRVDGNRLIGSLTIGGIPPTVARQFVNVRFTYDCNGVLEVEGEVQATGKKTTVVISSQAPHLDEVAIAAAVKSMQALKFHPREQEANIHLLRRAERIYKEVRPELREQFSQQITFFETALESQDPERVAAAREWFTELLDGYDLFGNEEA
ncbi:MAG: Hsp70 family protein [Planctomycetaceae bacterium]|nr:Hsp70 family protein [Planctomycetaceae bacterium]